MAVESNWSGVNLVAVIFHGQSQELDMGVGMTGIPSHQL